MKKTLTILFIFISILFYAQDYNKTGSIAFTAGGGTLSLDVAKSYDIFYISGTATLSSSWTIQSTGTPVKGTTFEFYYSADITLNGNNITILGLSLTDIESSTKSQITAYYNGASWETTIRPDFNADDIIATDHIQDGAVSLSKFTPLITGAMIYVDASGSWSPLYGSTSNDLLMYNGTVPDFVQSTGDVIIANTGVSTIQVDAVDKGMVNANVAGDGLQKLIGDELGVDVSDFAGNGLEDDGTENLRVKPDITNGTSLTATNNGLRLINDENSPTNLNYYGTDGSGNKGYHSLSSNGILYKEVTIPHISVVNIGTIPYELIPDPGAGKAIVIKNFSWYNDVTTLLEVGSQTLIIEYSAGSDISTISNADVESATDIIRTYYSDETIRDNQSVEVTLGLNTDPTSGSVVFKFYIYYYIISL